MNARHWTIAMALLLASTGFASAGQNRKAHRDGLEYWIDQLLYASDDDDREDAAEKLAKIGDTDALAALRKAAIYDKEDDVRDEARKAIKRIEEQACQRKGHRTAEAHRPNRTVVVREPARRVVVRKPARTVVVKRPESKVIIRQPVRKVVVRETPRKVIIRRPARTVIIRDGGYWGRPHHRWGGHRQARCGGGVNIGFRFSF